VVLGLRDVPCVVTGGTRGIGRAVVHRLIEEGARVLLVARSQDDAAKAAAELGAEWLAADVRSPDAAEQIIDACVRRFGGIQVLVNNAGMTADVPLDELSDADWQDQFELNVLGPMRLMRAAAPHMAVAGTGRIVNVSSTAGKRPTLANAAYSVTKAAELSLSRVFAEHWSRHGVLINAVTPGPVATPMWMAPGGLADQAALAAGVDRETLLRQRAERVPIGRFAEPHEIAEAIVFLCSPRASYVTGVSWSVDGGSGGGIM
jgi:3-oxoacyl-[acyl-carrier protein] reductase